MQVEVDRLGRLVADLLTLARLEAGSLQLEPAPESVADLLGDVAGVMQTLAEQAGVTLSVELPDDDAARARRPRPDRAGAAQLHRQRAQALAARHDHPPARGREGDAVRLEVSDEGSGIEPTRSRASSSASTAPTPHARAARGTGLGLAIAKEIVEAHGSSIEVESAPGAGTTFWFALPSA